MTDNTTPWNGIPDNPHESGWHWIGYSEHIEPHYWSSDRQAWTGGNAKDVPFSVLLGEYLGPATPPASRCRDGRKRIAVSARFIRDHDQVGVTMNDGSTHYLDGYYWRNDQPVIDVIGKTIPEIEAAADEYRRPASDEGTEP